MTDSEALKLAGWRARMETALGASDIRTALDALLSITYNEPDRLCAEKILRRIVESDDTEPQLKALAVTCIGHIARIHGAISPELVEVARSLVGDSDLGGIAEDALGDAEHFARRDSS